MLAVIGDVAHPAWCARAVGVYRLWPRRRLRLQRPPRRDLADANGIATASGPIVAVRMYETRPRTP
ncbi:hypothetical protein [Streptomyces sp. NPDC048825]|uniref:hypothetical protein n=1 Tax=Streptomyces sp. NPDC048825 TaxID=3365592 RepID=UPI003714C74E